MARRDDQDPYSDERIPYYTDPYAAATSGDQAPSPAQDAAVPRITYTNPAPPQPAAAPTPAAPAQPTFNQFAQVGHNATFNGLNREQYRDLWGQSGVTNLDGLQAWLAQHGGKLISNNGTVLTPYGEQIDMLGNAHTGNGTAIWMGAGGVAGGQSAASIARAQAAAAAKAPAIGVGARTGSGSTAGSGSGSSSLTASVTTAPRSAEMTALIQQLQQRANQGLAINPNDPIIKGQVDAYTAQGERARRNYLADAAESQSPYSTGELRGESRMTAEALGQNAGQFQSELMARELSARRDEIAQSLQELGNILTPEEQRSLQMELAQMDDAVKRYQIDTQNSQYYSGLGEQASEFARQLAQRQNEFGVNTQLQQDQLGLTAGDRAAYWNAVYSGILGG